jgi:hypothetical protein
VYSASRSLRQKCRSTESVSREFFCGFLGLVLLPQLSSTTHTDGFTEKRKKDFISISKRFKSQFTCELIILEGEMSLSICARNDESRGQIEGSAGLTLSGGRPRSGLAIVNIHSFYFHICVARRRCRPGKEPLLLFMESGRNLGGPASFYV